VSRPVLILRPEPANAVTVAQANLKGLNAVGFPLFAIQAVDWTAQHSSAFDALLLTSANALCHAGSGFEAYRKLPVYAVGPSTAKAARNAGLIVRAEGSAGVDALLAAIHSRKLLHLAGEDATLLSPHRHNINQVAVYRSCPIAPSPAFWALIDQGPIVLLHSARAAVYFHDLVKSVKIDRISIVAISAKVAMAAGSGWEAVALAAHPRDEAMIEAAVEIAARHDRVV
jgi:uroporphyrinogen-III synthase